MRCPHDFTEIDRLREVIRECRDRLITESDYETAGVLRRLMGRSRTDVDQIITRHAHTCEALRL